MIRFKRVLERLITVKRALERGDALSFIMLFLFMYCTCMTYVISFMYVTVRYVLSPYMDYYDIHLNIRTACMLKFPLNHKRW